MNSPKISIITINFNNKDGLERTISSVSSQNYTNFEYIIIDGGSTDGSRGVIEENSAKINDWVSEPDTGIYNAMNKGIAKATGEYLLFLNSGDLLHDTTSLLDISTQIDGSDLLVADIKLVNGNEKKIHYYPPKLSFFSFCKGAIGHPSTLIKRNLFERFGNYDESYKIVSDWEFFIRVLADPKTTYKKVGQVLSVFYMDGISTTNHEQTQRERLSILTEKYPFFYQDYQNFVEISTKNKTYTEINNKINRNIFVKILKKIRLLKL